MDILQAIEAKEVFRLFFRDLGTWSSWKTYFRALFGIPGEEKELKLLRDCTGLESWPTEPVKESFVVAGRRAGKSSITAIIAAYLALFQDWSKHLSPGEKGMIFIVACNKFQGQIIKQKIEAVLSLQPAFQKMVKRVLAEEIELTNGISMTWHRVRPKYIIDIVKINLNLPLFSSLNRPILRSKSSQLV